MKETLMDSIKQVDETPNMTFANTMLSAGWKLIGVFQHQEVQDEQSYYYVLGWPSDETPVVTVKKLEKQRHDAMYPPMR